MDLLDISGIDLPSSAPDPDPSHLRESDHTHLPEANNELLRSLYPADSSIIKRAISLGPHFHALQSFYVPAAVNAEEQAFHSLLNLQFPKSDSYDAYADLFIKSGMFWASLVRLLRLLFFTPPC